MALDKKLLHRKFLDQLASREVRLEKCAYKKGCLLTWVVGGSQLFDPFLRGCNDQNFGALQACETCGRRGKRFIASDGDRFGDVSFGDGAPRTGAAARPRPGSNTR
jgi:hypothetical protein